MSSRLKAGAIGVALIPFGALVLWGGISGNLAAILAALFAPAQLRKVPGSHDIPPMAIEPPWTEGEIASGKSVSPYSPSGTGSGDVVDVPGAAPEVGTGVASIPARTGFWGDVVKGIEAGARNSVKALESGAAG